MSEVSTSVQVLSDQKARDLIRRDLDRNVMVLAGAGAGKTYALVDRMVAAVRTGAAEIDRMAAITFTRKSAGEMRGRFYQRLRETRQDANEPLEAERINRALALIDQCFIGTIHSFCGRVLRERPLEAGLAPDFEEIEDRDETLIRRAAWDEFVQTRFGADDPRLRELDDHAIIPEDLYHFFGERCRNSDIPLKETQTTKPDMLPAAKHVQAFIDEVAPFIPAKPEKRDKLMTAVRRARHFIDNHGVASNRDAARLLSLFDGTISVTLKHWADRHIAREIRDETLPRLQQSVVAPSLRLWRECAYRIVADFVDDAVAYYDRRRQELGKVTFQDLLLRTAALLRDHPDVRRYFHNRFRTLLVDEFQDTDPVQAEILFYLTGTDHKETEWTRLVPRPGSLFLVGDDKQSIYRFRRADVEIFHFVAERIEETGGRVAQLNTSFRSLGTLCKWISSSFSPVFAQADAPYQAPFVPLREYRPPGLDPHCVRKITVEKVDQNARAEIARLDAGRTARFIAAALQGRTTFNHGGVDGTLAEQASPGDFLILTRTTGQLKTYADALEKNGIPYDISGGGRLGEAEEVIAIITMLRAVYDPHNPIPLVSYLRGPLAGFSDPELYAFKNTGGRLAFGASIPDELNAELRSRFNAAMERLRQAEADFMEFPPAAAFERILDRTGYLSYAAIHPGGGASSRAGNLLRVQSLIQQFSSMGWTWGRIVEELHALVSDGEYDLEETTLELGRQNVVRLMNLHQAKGLQAPVVFLADPYDSSYDREPQRHLSRSAKGTYLSMTVSKPKGEYGREVVAQPVGWEADKDEEMKFDAAEETRLLYVAATRAQNLLVISQYQPKYESGPWSALRDFLANAPELEDAQANAAAPMAAKPRDYATAADAARRRLQASTRPSYSVRTVTGDSPEEGGFRVHEGRGRDYGAIIHRLFEDALLGKLRQPCHDYVERVVLEAGLDSSLVSDAIEALNRFRTSTLWSDLRDADRVHTEVPIGAVDGEGNPVRGVIDLAYRANGRWTIVDYKTDAAPAAADVERLLLKYEPQVQEYAMYWQGITGESVERASIWLVHGPQQADQLSLF